MLDQTIFIYDALITIFESLFLGGVIGYTYIKTSDNKIYSHNFFLTLIIMPAIVAIIILLIGSNVARAFSLAGAFSIVRFRSAPGNPKDIAFIFFAMAAGLACGAEAYFYSLMFTFILCAVMFCFCHFKIGKRKSLCSILKITIPENLDYNNLFDDILQKYTDDYILNKVRTVDLGSLFELDYNIDLNCKINSKNMIDEIRCRNGNLNITLVLDNNDNEF